MWRDIDPRDDERERPDLSRASVGRSDDGASKRAESGDALTRDLDLPRGSTRGPVRDRDRWIDLRESEVRMLATAGAFRVVVASDLRDHRGRPASASNGELSVVGDFDQGAILPLVDKATDEPSADLLTQRLQVHEKTAWMLRSLLDK